MVSSSGKISISEATEALLRSGYLLESRIEALLAKRGFYVEANSAYKDPETGKSRELDIYAMGAEKAGKGEYDYVFPVLLVECVNNPQPLTLITKSPLLGFLHHKEVKVAGLPVKVTAKTPRNSWESLQDYLGMDKYHHYCKGRVATQFCSFKQKKDDKAWMALHEDAHFDALWKLCAAVDHFVEKHFESWVFNGRENVNIEFYYPLLVVQGDLLEVQLKKKTIEITSAEHLQFRRSAITRGEAEDYQIDVVTERFFPRYLGIVEREMARTARLMRRRHKAIRKSINQIVKSAKRLKSPAKIRAALEF